MPKFAFELRKTDRRIFRARCIVEAPDYETAASLLEDQKYEIDENLHWSESDHGSLYEIEDVDNGKADDDEEPDLHA